MVTIFSKEEAEEIESAISMAEKNTSAEIITVVVHKSDRYVAELMLFGFILGSLIDMLIYVYFALSKPPLMISIQLFCIFSIPFIPILNRFFYYLLPKKLLHHRAYQLGLQEFSYVTDKVPADQPVLLLYISLVEHYVHIFPNAVVKKELKRKIWDEVIESFTDTLKTHNVTQACLSTITKLTFILSPIFPEDNKKNFYSNKVTHSLGAGENEA